MCKIKIRTETCLQGIQMIAFELFRLSSFIVFILSSSVSQRFYLGNKICAFSAEFHVVKTKILTSFPLKKFIKYS